jgi:hypothetical protein
MLFYALGETAVDMSVLCKFRLNVGTPSKNSGLQGVWNYHRMNLTSTRVSIPYLFNSVAMNIHPHAEQYFLYVGQYK